MLIGKYLSLKTSSMSIKEHQDSMYHWLKIVVSTQSNPGDQNYWNLSHRLNQLFACGALLQLFRLSIVVNRVSMLGETTSFWRWGRRVTSS